VWLSRAWYPTGTGTSLDAQRRLLVKSVSTSLSSVRFGYVPTATERPRGAIMPLSGASHCAAFRFRGNSGRDLRPPNRGALSDGGLEVEGNLNSESGEPEEGRRRFTDCPPERSGIRARQT
jgi:hypothetical protein